VLAPLGKIYYDYAKLDPARLNWQPASAGISPVTAIFVDISVKNSVISRNGYQTVTVSVKDQRGKEVSGAAVTLVIKSPGGAQQVVSLPITDAKGKSVYSFNIGPALPGNVINFEATASYPVSLIVLTANDRTSCMVWFF